MFFSSSNNSNGGNPFLEFFEEDVVTPFPYNPEDYKAPGAAIGLGVVSASGIIANLLLFCYILWQKLYKNFISSHFIAHLCITDAVALAVLTPMLVYSFWYGDSPWILSNGMCRLQAFVTCSVWAVVNYMILCIAGVHVLTFARIHYDQLFGLHPMHHCVLAWIVAFFLSLPCITNGHIVHYDPIMRTCLWGRSDASYKFLAYFIILGVLIPMVFVYYAYLRVLGILYHSPIVFQSIGLYKSRFLVYGFLVGTLYQVPFFIVTLSGTNRFSPSSYIPIISMCMCFMQIFLAPVLYGLSLIQMKEEDMALTARAHKTHNAYHPVNSAQNV